MTSNSEARALGYADRIHYKYYSYMSINEYKKTTGTAKRRNLNNVQACKYGEKVIDNMRGIILEIEEAARNPNMMERHTKELYEMRGMLKSIVGVSSNVQRSVQYLIKGIDSLLNGEKCIKEELEDECIKHLNDCENYVTIACDLAQPR